MYAKRARQILAGTNTYLPLLFITKVGSYASKVGSYDIKIDTKFWRAPPRARHILAGTTARPPNFGGHHRAPAKFWRTPTCARQILAGTNTYFPNKESLYTDRIHSKESAIRASAQYLECVITQDRAKRCASHDYL